MTYKTKTQDATKKPPVPEKHPGMLGDGTEEQNLNQTGNTGARIMEDELDAAFGTPKK